MRKDTEELSFLDFSSFTIAQDITHTTFSHCNLSLNLNQCFRDQFVPNSMNADEGSKTEYMCCYVRLLYHIL